MMILITILVYFAALFLFSRLTNKNANNDTFFRGNRKSPWYMVAFGMVGASISGVTFVSVPGMVMRSDMTYLQTCLGFIFGYAAVAFILLPVYYRHDLTTIYSYLDKRLGTVAYKTGSWFFILSKMTGAAVRFYVVCIILQQYVFDSLDIPFPATVVTMVSLIWLYTRSGGIKTLVWTDTFQTICLFSALVLILLTASKSLGAGLTDVLNTVAESDMSRIFVFEDPRSTQYFWKQFLSGIFIVVVMTGLDQDMMQKNLTCKTLREAQKDMCTYGFAFFPANFLFLSLGVMLVMLAESNGIALPHSGDELLPMFAASGYMGQMVVVMFTIGIVAASFSSADSALTSLTTCCCIDIFNRPSDESFRKKVHFSLAFIFAAFILCFKHVNSTSVIDAIYIMCSYTYGPLLGLFAFALFTRRMPLGHLVPVVAIVSPCLCFGVDCVSQYLWNYRFGYELLMLNGALTFSGLWLLSVGRR